MNSVTNVWLPERIELQPLLSEQPQDQHHPGCVSSGPVEACDQPGPGRIEADDEHDRNRREIAASGLFSLPLPEFESDQAGILNSPAVMLFGLPRRQRLPKSLPQLHIRHTAAQTRTVSTAQFQPNPRKL